MDLPNNGKRLKRSTVILSDLIQERNWVREGVIWENLYWVVRNSRLHRFLFRFAFFSLTSSCLVGRVLRFLECVSCVILITVCRFLVDFLEESFIGT